MKLLPLVKANMKPEENWPALDSRGKIVRGIRKDVAKEGTLLGSLSP